jgi:nucleoside-diphosphate-sugar epimerase
MGLNTKKIAAVTGARGLIGQSIVKQLLQIGWSVRVLTRSDIPYGHSEAQVIVADINNKNELKNLLHEVDAVFHCAGEIHNENLMYSTNVIGTKNLLKAVKKSNVGYFCHISSAGVIGHTNELSIDEYTPCNPKGVYEKTKYKSEKLVLNSNLPVNIVILRPTNVVSVNKPGVFLQLAIQNSWKDKLKVLITGGENAHIIYVDDVARAALFFLGNKKKETNIYFVSNDDELNTVSGIYNSYISICENSQFKIKMLFPLFVPHLMRRIYRGSSLHGRSRFSSNKIKEQGFHFKFSTKKSINFFCK